MKAYVLIKVNLGSSPKVIEELQQIGGIHEAHAITGPFDAIVMLDAPNPQEIATLVMNRIQKIEGVKETMTCFVLGN
jgi:DNA-binding Lrp family transcriptional regulator